MFRSLSTYARHTFLSLLVSRGGVSCARRSTFPGFFFPLFLIPPHTTGLTTCSVQYCTCMIFIATDCDWYPFILFYSSHTSSSLSCPCHLSSRTWPTFVESIFSHPLFFLHARPDARQGVGETPASRVFYSPTEFADCHAVAWY